LNDGAATRGLPPLAALPVLFYLYLAGFGPLVLLPGAFSHFQLVLRSAGTTGFVRSSSILAFP
jgi:hypothetical protein